MLRKSVNPEAPWDWVRIGEGVKAAYQQAKDREGGRLNQTDFGRPYGFTQGEISKLINRKFSEPSIKLEKGLTAMLGTIPRVTQMPESERPELGPVGAVEMLQLANLDERYPRALGLLRIILSEGDEILRGAIINNLESFARAAQEHMQLEALQRGQPSTAQSRRGRKGRR